MRIEKDMDKTFSCGITLYHPTEINFTHVMEHAKLFHHVYVFDNTENGIPVEKRALLEVTKNISIISTGENEGLSRAYNALCTTAYRDGFLFMVLYDQDSEPSADNIHILQEYIINQGQSDVAVYGPRVCDADNRDHVRKNEIIEETDAVMSSGSFVNLDIFMKSDKFDEKFFIDNVDDDYCYMVRGKGYRIIRNNNSILYHMIGEHKKVFGKIVEQHSSIRMYYIVRNHLYFYSKYGLKECNILWLLNRIRHVLFYDDEKLDKIIMMLRGGYDYKKKRYGKYKRKLYN